MNILKREIEISDSFQLDAYINASHGKIKGVYWETSIDFAGETETPIRGIYSRQLDKESGEEQLVFISHSEDRIHPYRIVIPKSVALNGCIVVLSRKKL